MPAPPQTAVEPVFDEIRATIIEVVRGAWSDWRSSSYSGVWRCNRSRANFVWEQIIERAHLAFADHTGVRIIESHQTFSFLVAEQVLFRFKKVDEDGLTANVPTQLALAFHDHEQDLFGLPDVHRVEVGYKLNRLQTDVQDVIVVGREGKTVSWTFSLLGADEKAVPLPIGEPVVEPSVKPGTRLVRPRENGEAPDRIKRD